MVNGGGGDPPRYRPWRCPDRDPFLQQLVSLYVGGLMDPPAKQPAVMVTGASLGAYWPVSQLSEELSAVTPLNSGTGFQPGMRLTTWRFAA